MQSIEIDPELNRLALAEAAQQYPEFAEHALRVIARPLFKGFAWQLERPRLLLRPMPMKGRLGLFEIEIPDELLPEDLRCGPDS